MPVIRSGACRRCSFDGRIAQLVEQLTLNQRVLGSSPSAPTIERITLNGNVRSPLWSPASLSRADLFDFVRRIAALSLQIFVRVDNVARVLNSLPSTRSPFFQAVN